MNFPPATRSRITTTVHRTGSWRGRRAGALCEVKLERDKPPGEQFTWGVCRARHWTRGRAETTFAALMRMERF